MTGKSPVIGQFSISNKCGAALLLFMVTTLPAAGQPIFSARDFPFTLQLKRGSDVWPDPSATPMALNSKGIYAAGAFLFAGGGPPQPPQFQTFLWRYDRSGNELWTRPPPGRGSVFPAATASDTISV